jgi:hypothetical protein
MTIPAFPLQWPAGWKRTPPAERTSARFGKASRARAGGGWENGRPLTINEGVERTRSELARMDIHADDLVISTNLELRLDGFPKSAQREPADPGAAAYWIDGDQTRCMAIDRYDRVADNLAAIAATLDAMRAIKRHGGAEILNRAFTGFAAIAHNPTTHWSDILEVDRNCSTVEARAAFKRLRSIYHPDKQETGDAEMFKKVTQAYSDACAEHGVQE